MRFADLVRRVTNEGSRGWDIYYKAQKMAREGRDVINLCIGDPDFDSPSVATEAAISALRTGDTHYADIPGRWPLRSAIAEQFSARTGIKFDGHNAIVLAGAQNAAYAACQCLFQAGDEVIVPEPMYITYDATISATGAKIVRVPSPAAKGFHVDLEALAAAITPRTRGIMFATPNNPTGAVMTRAELERIAELAKTHDLWVVSDEVYGAFTYDGAPHVSMASLPGMAERTVTISSLAKSHAMPGWRVGWVIGPKPLVQHLETLSLALLYGLAGFVQQGALAAITQGEADVEHMRAAYTRRRTLVMDALKRVQTLRVRAPEGGMFVLLDVEPTGLGALPFAEQLLEATGTALLPADAFGESARGHLRLCYGLSDEVLADACERIAGFCAGLETDRA
jgi:arginine:pyruvate transaminase